MNFNFFDWIREGVRQSVLLGVSDAVDRLGTPAEGDEVRRQLLDFVDGDGSTARRRTGGSSRKKLGRSLKQIQAAGEKAA